MSTQGTPVAPGSKTRHFKWELSEDGSTVTAIAVALPDAPRKTFAVSRIHKDLHSKVMQYGLKQLLSDRTAATALTADKLSGMQDTIDDLAKGVWSERKPSETTAVASKLHRAVARAYGITVERVQEVFRTKKDALTDQEYKAWVENYRTKDTKVAAAMAAILAEEAREAAKAAKGAEPNTSAAEDFGAAA